MAVGTESILYDSTLVYQSNTGKWRDEAYRAITLTSPLQYTGKEEFVKWFTDNAKPYQPYSSCR